MPVISVFFGIVIRMYYLEHGVAHFHAEHQGQQASFTLDGRLLAVAFVHVRRSDSSPSGRQLTGRSWRRTGSGWRRGRLSRGSSPWTEEMR
jgi:hypothetical protein